jgi:hypothetical protein
MNVTGEHQTWLYTDLITTDCGPEWVAPDAIRDLEQGEWEGLIGLNEDGLICLIR